MSLTSPHRYRWTTSRISSLQPLVSSGVVGSLETSLRKKALGLYFATKLSHPVHFTFDERLRLTKHGHAFIRNTCCEADLQAVWKSSAAGCAEAASSAVVCKHFSDLIVLGILDVLAATSRIELIVSNVKTPRLRRCDQQKDIRNRT